MDPYRLWEMQVRIGHAQLLINPAETQLPVRALERQRVSNGYLTTIQEPLVHAPEVSRANVQVQGVHNARDQGQLFSGPNWAADAYRIVLCALSPSVNVLEGLGQVKLLGESL
jgi:hypothetical protein